MTNTLTLPHEYQTKLKLIQTEIAITTLKDHFEDIFSKSLNLLKVSAPLLLDEGTGINDNLNGTERMVTFDASDVTNTQIEIVQSLAKWKRIALNRYGFALGEGLYTNMNAIRRDEKLDNIHSMYVDQWDWEKVISLEQRNLETLKTEVHKIYQVMKSIENHMYQTYPVLEPILPEEIYYITTLELEKLFPNLTPQEREGVIAKEHGAVFIMQIGGFLHSGEKHDGRSPDYDDWKLNGDMVFWNPVLERAFEVSSMGIRVDEEALLNQLEVTNSINRSKLDYHKAILSGSLPYTIGGGIGQSRLCMFFLKKAHIGEVQASVWNCETLSVCKEHNITLL